MYQMINSLIKKLYHLLKTLKLYKNQDLNIIFKIFLFIIYLYFSNLEFILMVIIFQVFNSILKDHFCQLQNKFPNQKFNYLRKVIDLLLMTFHNQIFLMEY